MKAKRAKIMPQTDRRRECVQRLFELSGKKQAAANARLNLRRQIKGPIETSIYMDNFEKELKFKEAAAYRARS